MKRISNKYILILCLLAMASACKKGLDYKDPNSISPDNVWKDANMIKAYLTDIYGIAMPGWDLSSGNNTDEAYNSPTSMTAFSRGIISVDQTNTSMNYTVIDKSNFFLDQLATVPATVLDPAVNARYQGEAKFWRAWTYWNMVNAIGGVPLILHTQDATNFSSLKVPRAKTSECIAQMVKDLDSAASLLPGSYTGADYGRITKVAALGLKGRILMWWASPVFNPNNDQTRWQNAYNATKAAVDAATAAGNGLVDNFRSIWYNRNKEQIMVRQYDFSKANGYVPFNNVRPIPFTNNATDNNMPQLSLLMAYPKKDGSFLQLSDTSNFDQFMTDFYANRDDRFYATIYSGGTVYPTPDIFIGETTRSTYWMAWAMKNGGIRTDSNINRVIYPAGASTTNYSSFRYRRIDTTQTGPQSATGVNGNTMWWVPMRYAELYLNYGECANEVGKGAEVLQVLKDIRKRANIIAGANGNYGITASTQAEFRTAIMKERQVELAYENFRLGDLRRWKRYDVLNAQGTRKLLILTLKEGAPLPGKTQTIMEPAVRANFKFTYVSNLDGAGYSYNYDLNHWFNALNPAQMSTEPDQLPQNKEWGGTFDPLQ
ncbi:RagB/SusD family nutrient uptake outer membrane protein [Chitinophagaceae bacterium LB-8]|uniref:RagB/SusD family nutrient uptake outer membrane protein n=1 Tax=Paraflavisolibacter caeni TaxID=2982496 RepID=A0A9X3B9V5_9BACT|nr:RagB/SusD family nutrient uptake outer membrane protein [Paraflavisolibacter caeni]MCU7552530.1 RagB/SusD family nutrient uptake outer membrane protein [Paraflavisolibacter caeni]